MRNLEDCKAEVFRRSEERIKERKRTRNRVLVCCIPLCLLLVAGGLYIRPLLEPVDEVTWTNGGTTGVPGRELGGVDYALYWCAITEDTMKGSTTAGSVTSASTTGYTCVSIKDRTGDAEVSLEITDKDSVEALCGVMAMYHDMTVTKESLPIGKAEQDGATAGQDRDTIIDGLDEKYDLDDKPADYKLVFRSSNGGKTVFRLYGKYLYHEGNGCVVKLSDAQLTALRTQIEQVVENGNENSK